MQIVREQKQSSASFPLVTLGITLQLKIENGNHFWDVRTEGQE